jgi:hypothetical protein
MRSPIEGGCFLGFGTDCGLTVYFVVVDAYLRRSSGGSATSASAETLAPHSVGYVSSQQTIGCVLFVFVPSSWSSFHRTARTVDTSTDFAACSMNLGLLFFAVYLLLG